MLLQTPSPAVTRSTAQSQITSGHCGVGHHTISEGFSHVLSVQLWLCLSEFDVVFVPVLMQQQLSKPPPHSSGAVLLLRPRLLLWPWHLPLPLHHFCVPLPALQFRGNPAPSLVPTWLWPYLGRGHRAWSNTPAESCRRGTSESVAGTLPHFNKKSSLYVTSQAISFQTSKVHSLTLFLVYQISKVCSAYPHIQHPSSWGWCLIHCPDF